MSENTRRPLAVFDIDNTLADTGHRQHFLERRPRDWSGFFGAAPTDPPLGRGWPSPWRARPTARWCT